MRNWCIHVILLLLEIRDIGIRYIFVYELFIFAVHIVRYSVFIYRHL